MNATTEASRDIDQNQLARQLRDKLEVNAKPNLSYAVQLELGYLIILLQNLERKKRYDLLPSLDLALSYLLTDGPNLITAQTIRYNIEDQIGTSIMGRPFIVLHRVSSAGDVVLGLITSFIGSVGTVSLLFSYLLYLRNQLAMHGGQHTELIDNFYEISPLFLLVAFTGLAGSIISILTRINEFATMFNVRAYILFLTGLFKPIIGSASAPFIWAVVNAGIISFPIDNSKEYYAWGAISFVAGFSERLVPDLVRKFESMFSENESPGTAKG